MGGGGYMQELLATNLTTIEYLCYIYITYTLEYHKHFEWNVFTIHKFNKDESSIGAV